MTNKPKSKSKQKPVLKVEPIDSSEMTIELEPISIEVIKIGGKKLPLSVYRQFPVIDVIDHTDKLKPRIVGKILGRIASKVRNGVHNSYHHQPNDSLVYDVLWVTPENTLAVWPMTHITHDGLYIMQLIPLPDRTNIFNKHSTYRCNINKALEVFKDIKLKQITSWEKYGDIPPEPDRILLEFGKNLNLHCGLNNESRLELTQQLKRDMESSITNQAVMEEWSKTAHHVYDEYIHMAIPIVEELNRRISKRNKVYQYLIKQLNQGHQLFVGS